MAKPIPKRRPKFAKSRLLRDTHDLFPKQTVGITGVDISMSSIAVASIAYDVTLRRRIGPEFQIWRWETNTHYFDRITDCAHCEEFILESFKTLRSLISRDNIYIAVEEPWPFGMVKKLQSQYLKQQAEISGAFLAGLLRYGFRNIYQIQANSWRKIVADELGITIHHSKWKDPTLCEIYNCKPEHTGKFRAKQWAMQSFPELPDWPEIIETKMGKAPRPEDSRAKAVQCDDRYDALAVMEWMHREWRSGNA